MVKLSFVAAGAAAVALVSGAGAAVQNGGSNGASTQAGTTQGATSSQSAPTPSVPAATSQRPRSGAPLPEVKPTPNAQRQPSGIPDAAAYHLNPGDGLNIYVWGDERLQRDQLVLPDGSIAFPLVGTIRAAGRTSTQLENDIAQRLAAQYKGDAPQVTVSVRSPTGLTFSVIGKVRQPGSSAPGRYINLLEAIANAGGPSDFADVNNIVILRKEGGKTVLIPTEIGSVLKGHPSTRDLGAAGIPMLQPGDTVIVP